MAIGFRGESHDIANSGGTLTLTEPTGTAQGDVLVYLYVAGTSATITQPSGWTTIYSGNSLTPSFGYRVAYVVRGVSAPDLSWVITGNPYHEVHLLGFSGCNTSNPIDASAQTTSDSGINPDPPSVTAVSNGALALAIGINWNGSGSGGWTPPTGYTLRTYLASGVDGAMASKLLGSVGAEDPSAYANAAGTATDRWSATVTLAPLPTTIPLQWVQGINSP